MSFQPFAPTLDAAIRLARDAGALIMEIYAGGFEVRDKRDASPVTEADERAEVVLVEGLRRLMPGVPIVAEEQMARGHTPTEPLTSFWLVDPLDGTKEFINRNGEFTVNLALIQEGRPVLGVVYAPALGRLFAGAAGLGSVEEEAGVRRPIRVRPVPEEGLTVVESRSHADSAGMTAFLRGRNVSAFKSAGSSLKFCLVAAGEADVYPRLGRTMEWDTAAGHAILLASGGSVQDMAGTALRYGKPGFENPHFVALGAALVKSTP
jgi:3'(2'), 5'-bisphosphate nucleotidase